MQIRCTQGPATTDIMGQTYRFERNAYGHYVAEVTNIRHQECLLSAAWAYCKYEEPSPEAPQEPESGEVAKNAPETVPAAEPVGLTQYADDGRDTGEPGEDAPQAANEQPDATDTADETQAPADEVQDAPEDEGGEPDPAASDAAIVDEGTDADADTMAKPLEDMSKNELKAEAEKRGVKITARMNKDEITEAILAAED